MAINLNTAYPGKTTPADLDYPQGSARNISGPNTGDGFPFDQKWINDHMGFFQAIIKAAELTPSGSPDTATNSQYLEGLRALFLPSVATVAAADYPAANANVLNDSGRAQLVSFTGSATGAATLFLASDARRANNTGASVGGTTLFFAASIIVAPGSSWRWQNFGATITISDLTITTL